MRDVAARAAAHLLAHLQAQRNLQPLGRAAGGHGSCVEWEGTHICPLRKGSMALALLLVLVLVLVLLWANSFRLTSAAAAAARFCGEPEA